MQDRTGVRLIRVVILAGILLLTLDALTPLAPVLAQERVLPSVPLAAPTPDPTTTALEKAKLAQEVEQLRSQNQRGWWWTNGTALLSAVLTAVVALVVAIFGLIQWRGNRRDTLKQRRQEQDRWLQDRAVEREKRTEERFEAIVTDLCAERGATQASATVLISTFLQPEYQKYHDQVFRLLLASSKIVPSDEANRDTVVGLLVDALQEAMRLRLPVLRRERPEFVLDAYDADWPGIDLHELDLQGSDLGHVNMDGANLTHANLSRVRGIEIWLQKARLSRANLEEARLHQAHAAGAWFHQSRLVSTKLRGAVLSGAHFSQACLQSAHLDNAKLSGAKFENADLNDTFFIRATFDDAALRSMLRARCVKARSQQARAILRTRGPDSGEDLVRSWRLAHFDDAVRTRLEDLNRQASEPARRAGIPEPGSKDTPQDKGT